MDVFLVDGSSKCFADIIIDNKITGVSCVVASWGFGSKQVKRIVDSFDNVLLVSDTSHSRLNSKAYREVVEMSNTLSNFTFKPEKTHAKLALIDNEVIIFTSANLSANQRLESYMIGKFSEVNGIDKLRDMLGDPGDVFKPKHNDTMEIDFDLNLDFF